MDSRVDTYQHIHQVQLRLDQVLQDLKRRLLFHDASKLQSPELEVYDRYEAELRAHDYNTPGYWKVLRLMEPAIRHHYEHNSHHPEHYAGGVRGMSLLDLMEMLCDWDAAAQRRPQPMLLPDSIDLNQKRFGYSDELRQILLNSAQYASR